MLFHNAQCAFTYEQYDEALELYQDEIAVIDGMATVYTRQQQFDKALMCPCELWRVDSDGEGLERLVADGRAPAWSTGAPTVRPPPNPNATPRAWLPLVLR